MSHAFLTIPAQAVLCFVALLLASQMSLAAVEAGQLQWPAGELEPSQAITLLADSGGPTRLLGATHARSAQLPAFEGSYWEAVLLLCETFDLELRPAVSPTSHRHRRQGPQIAFDSGPVELAPAANDNDKATAENPSPEALAAWLGMQLAEPGRRQRPAPQQLLPHGPVLVQVIDAVQIERRSRGELQRHAAVILSLRLEPSLAESAIGSSTLHWHAATSADGRQLQLADARPEEEHLHMIGHGLGASPEMVVHIKDPPAGLRQLRLEGTLSLEGMAAIRHDMTLEPGVATTFELAETSITATLVEDRQAHGRAETGLLLESDDDPHRLIGSVQARITGPDGSVLRSSGGRTSSANRSSSRLIRLRAIPAGACTVTIVAQVPGQRREIPITIPLRWDD